MKKGSLSDRQLIDLLLRESAGRGEENKALAQIYRQNKAQVVAMILRNGGAAEAAKDVFQEAMIVFYENVKSGKFRAESAIGTYLYSVARFIWLNRMKRQKKERQIMEEQSQGESLAPALDDWLEAEQREVFQNLFDQLGTNCKEVLIDSIYYDYSMKEIAKRMQYDNEQVVRNRKYHCLKQLKKLLAEKPALIQLLKTKP